MTLALNRTVRVVLAGIAVAALGGFVWSHLHDDWKRHLLRLADPVKAIVKPGNENDNVRDSTDKQRASKSNVGQVKKCELDGKVTYTDQDCPVGAKMVPIDGGAVNVLGSPKPKTSHASSAQSSQKSPSDSLDLPTIESIKNKMKQVLQP